MTYEQAMKAIEDGKRVTCELLSRGWVVKLEGGEPDCEGCSVVDYEPGIRAPACELCFSQVKVVHETTGSHFDFIVSEVHKAAEWSIVEGWSSYGT